MKVIASHNGLQATALAYQLMKDGRAPLDACVEGVTLVEDDPEDLTVGYGGLPNEDGVVELDAAVMDGGTHRGAGVAALQKIRHPTKVARLLMQQTNRVLLVGEGALRFALANGFVEENLLTERARKMWLYWKRTRSTVDDWLPPSEDEADLAVRSWFEKKFYGSPSAEAARASESGTVHLAALDQQGDFACATSTSGHAFKMAGRVGDSPILGAGLYADNDVGTCGSIGHGEANLQHLSSFAAVELMRGGMPPRDAGLQVLQRIASKCRADERDAEGRPKFNLQLFLLAKDACHAGVALWGPKQIAITDAAGTRLEDCSPLFDPSK
jgi:N4-(beta-N-acetylglucosaminyl)-L-asparaginase